jgi:hypothetical protein
MGSWLGDGCSLGVLGVTLRVWAALCLTVFVSGCKEELAPEHFVTTRVQGTVSFGRKPVTKGWIEFWPNDGGVGVMRSAPIQSDGSFDATRVPVGRNTVGLEGTDLPRTIAKEFVVLRANVQRVIPAGPKSELKIDLLEELARLSSAPGT